MRKIWGWCVLAALLPVACMEAGIDVKERYDVHEPIVATVTDEASVYFWDLSATFKAIEVGDGKTLYIWAPPGRHQLKCILLTIDWEAHTVAKKSTQAEFMITISVDFVNSFQDPVAAEQTA